MRVRSAILLLALWLLAPTGGLGLALHGHAAHRGVGAGGEAGGGVVVNKGAVGCASACCHALPESVPAPEETPGPERDDDGPGDCSTCRVLTLWAPVLVTDAAVSAPLMGYAGTADVWVPVRLSSGSSIAPRARAPPTA